MDTNEGKVIDQTTDHDRGLMLNYLRITTGFVLA